MDNQKLKLYYMYFIPITIIQSIASLLMIVFYSVDDYGKMTLYLTNINFFFFLTLGTGLGYTLLYKQELKDSSFTNSFNILANLICSLAILTTIIVYAIYPFSNLLFLSILSASLMVIFSSHKAIFQTNYQIHYLNLYILSFRLIFILDIIFYYFTNSLITTLYFDVSLRLLVSIIGNIIIYNSYPKSNITLFMSDLNQLLQVIQLGIPIMVGNWITMLYLLADKYVLRDDLVNLGYYSFAITIVLLMRVLITPLKDLLFVSMANENSSSKIDKSLQKCIYSGSVLAVLGAVCSTIAMTSFGLFSKYSDAQTSLLLLLGILPISISLDIILFNQSRIKSGKWFLLKTSASGILMFCTLLLYKTTTPTFNLNVFSLIVLLNYLIIFIIFTYRQVSTKTFIKLCVLLMVFETVYTLIVNAIN